jgi:hypothetical protein
VADHAGAAADVAFGGRRAADRAVEGGERVLLHQGEGLDIAQPAVVGLGDHRQMEGLGRAVAHRDGRDGVVGDGVEQPGGGVPTVRPRSRRRARGIASLLGL